MAQQAIMWGRMEKIQVSQFWILFSSEDGDFKQQLWRCAKFVLNCVLFGMWLDLFKTAIVTMRCYIRYMLH